jgi:hypothetical protein
MASRSGKYARTSTRALSHSNRNKATHAWPAGSGDPSTPAKRRYSKLTEENEMKDARAYWITAPIEKRKQAVKFACKILKTIADGTISNINISGEQSPGDNVGGIVTVKFISHVEISEEKQAQIWAVIEQFCKNDNSKRELAHIDSQLLECYQQDKQQDEQRRTRDALIHELKKESADLEGAINFLKRKTTQLGFDEDDIPF